MRIARVETQLHLRAPSPHPVRDALQTLPGSGRVDVLVHTDDGLVGRGDAAFGRMRGAPEVVQAIVDGMLAPLVEGRDPGNVRGIHEDLLRETEYGGSDGLVMFAIGALNTALWDLLGKAAGWPVHRLLGTFRDRIPAYAMVGWLNYDEDELAATCVRALEQGFRAVKMKVGCPTLEEDVRRIERVRAAVGADTVVMVDANQALTTAEAIRRGRVFGALDCYWFEEPLPAEDVEGYAELARALDIPVATGENLYGRHAFAPFVRRGAVDVVQGDLRRAGGPTEVLGIAALADAHRLPYASHGGGPVNLNLLATMPNAVYLETGLLGAGNPVVLDGGCALVPQAPGFAW
ncbi:MAG TPA: mandelate racemase/muconate lactonizing enzyme family protein [Armatimonadota bacterium]|nr:mandelate racemase/muconate lactonizing enzyme family protein [Armatimonadota bacterium]